MLLRGRTFCARRIDILNGDNHTQLIAGGEYRRLKKLQRTEKGGEPPLDRSRLFLRGSFFFDQVIHYLNCTFSSADHVRGSDVLSVDGVGGRTVDFIGLPSFESAVIFDFGRDPLIF